MTTTETTAPGSCAEHGDRPAVGTCGRCARALCVECAIPFRGSLRCESCAALDLGDPAPAPQPRRRRLGLERLALACLVVAAGAGIAPWHRSGTLTSLFSAWRPSPDPWSMASAASAILAALVAGLALRRGTPPRSATAGWAVLAGAAAVATLVSMIRAPDFFSLTPAPMVMLLATATAASLGVVRARRFRP